MATKQQAIKALEKIECTDYDLEYEDSSLYSPIGFIWCASNCHTLIISTWESERRIRINPKTKAPIYWDYVLEEINAGLNPCTDEHCETCNNF